MSSSIPQKHPSESIAQQNAEREVIAGLSVRLGVTLQPHKLPIGLKSPIQLDGFCQNPPILVEVYARIGKPKPAQKDKVASDILKLLLAERILTGQWKKILAFADTDTWQQDRPPTSWLTKACKEFGIEIMPVQIKLETRDLLLCAQSQQVMVNPNSTATTKAKETTGKPLRDSPAIAG